MSVKDTVRKQYARLLDRAAERLAGLYDPPEGWLATMRKALGMSGAQVASRMGVTRNAVYQAERNERDGAITIHQMEKLAEAMGGRFVYAVVPRDSVADIMRAQAYRKAESRVRRAGAHMALEKQALPDDLTRQRVADLAEELVRDMPSDFWDAK